MEALWSNEVWRVSILAFLVGLAAGGMVVYAVFRPEHARRRRLQAEVERLEGEMKAYREEVNEHFRRTSELFETLTSSYRAFYEHLAGGARRLCRGERPVPALDIPGARLPGPVEEGQGSTPAPALQGTRQGSEGEVRGGPRAGAGGGPTGAARPEDQGASDPAASTLRSFGFSLAGGEERGRPASPGEKGVGSDPGASGPKPE
jgi:uncharacterized membrane-anchored protein YhcB (DUF1043 family)